MSKTPFEIRLELLKMAKEMMEQDYFAKRDKISNEWHSSVEMHSKLNMTPPEYPELPPYPSEQEIIDKAQALNNFISTP
jgi:hypothetical protein